jgi:hypothetical protein
MYLTPDKRPIERRFSPGEPDEKDVLSCVNQICKSSLSTSGGAIQIGKIEYLSLPLFRNLATLNGRERFLSCEAERGVTTPLEVSRDARADQK